MGAYLQNYLVLTKILIVKDTNLAEIIKVVALYVTMSIGRFVGLSFGPSVGPSKFSTGSESQYPKNKGGAFLPPNVNLGILLQPSYNTTQEREKCHAALTPQTSALSLALYNSSL